MHVVYAHQPVPERYSMAIFLAGPTPRRADVPSWRPAALRCLEAQGFDGVVLIPEPEHGGWRADYDQQVEWEQRGLELADRVLFWVPRDMATLPGLTTNVEFGQWIDSGKVVLGFPPGAPSCRYLRWRAEHAHAPVLDTLEATVAAAIADFREAGARSGGERFVPLHIFRTAVFQSWYQALLSAGNRLDEARVLWAFRLPRRPDAPVFSFVLRVKVWVTAEQRHKGGEWVFARPDIAVVVLYRAAGEQLSGEQSLAAWADTEVVLVREFRSPARTTDGFVHEPPGGSSPDPSEPALVVAAAEVREETGLVIAPERLVPLGQRQLAATLSAHTAKVYAAALTAEELAQAKAMAAAGQVHGENASERTYLEVRRLRDLARDPDIDWSSLGMIAGGLLQQALGALPAAG